MIALLKKDILLCRKWALIFLGMTMLWPVVVALSNETEKVTLLVFMLFPMMGNSVFLIRTCYMDDSIHTRKFLAALPVKRSCLIGSKYMLALACVVVSVGITTVMALALGMKVMMHAALLSSARLLLYYAVVLFAFYKSDYSNAEKANTACLSVFMLLTLMISRSGIDLDTDVLNPLGPAAAVLAASLVFAGSYMGSVRASKRSK